MEIRTKYDIGDQLYFIHRRKVRYVEVIGIGATTVQETGTEVQTIVIFYSFDLNERSPVDKAQNQVFKRRADLIKSLE